MNLKVRFTVFFVLVAFVVFVLFMMIPDAKQAVSRQKAVIVIDAGHGGFDGGAQGRVTEVKESEINLIVAIMLRDLCQNNGYTVVMTRTDDDALAGSKQGDMQQRRRIIEEAKPDLVVSIHMNKFSDPSVSGPQVFYYKESCEGKKIAKMIQESLDIVLEIKRPRPYKAEDYYILRCSESPCVLVECGFLSNEREERLLKTKDYQQNCADAIFLGINKYCSLPFIKNTQEEIAY